jgi:hypothetical protein
VRISNSALVPGDFLAAPRPRIEWLAVTNGTLTFVATAGQPGATCYVLQTANAALPMNYWSPVATRVFDTNGNCSFSTGVNPAGVPLYFGLRAITRVPSPGPLTYQLAGGSETWPADIRARIVYAMDGAVALYNKYGTFRKSLTANYNSGVPTAQASYSGWIDFGGQIGYRTALHEVSHTLGVGTVWNWSNFMVNGTWTGANALQQVRVFDGPAAGLWGDGVHFWPYGLNYESEGGTEANRRHVLMVAALRKDLGIQ